MKPIDKDERWENNERRNREVNERLARERMMPQEYSPAYHIKLIVDKAIAQNKWLFHKGIKKWYTPEEYQQAREKVVIDGSKDWEKLEIRDPMDGINAADEIIEDAMSRKKILVERVVKYYQDKKKV